MSMKWCVSKFCLLVFSLTLLSVSPSYSQETTKYDHRIDKYRNFWMKLIPSHYKLQLWGGMGIASAGIGWDYGKKEQWEIDILLGFIPKYSSRKARATLTLKQNYTPWSIGVHPHLAIQPLSCGLYFNTVFDGDFWVRDPDRYPGGYYNIPTKIRSNIFIGQRITYIINPEKRNHAKSLSLFYELSTCDIYLISGIKNSYLRARDYMVISFGIKAHIF